MNNDFEDIDQFRKELEFCRRYPLIKRTAEALGFWQLWSDGRRELLEAEPGENRRAVIAVFKSAQRKLVFKHVTVDIVGPSVVHCALIGAPLYVPVLILGCWYIVFSSKW